MKGRHLGSVLELLVSSQHREMHWDGVPLTAFTLPLYMPNNTHITLLHAKQHSHYSYTHYPYTCQTTTYTCRIVQSVPVRWLVLTNHYLELLPVTTNRLVTTDRLLTITHICNVLQVTLEGRDSYDLLTPMTFHPWPVPSGVELWILGAGPHPERTQGLRPQLPFLWWRPAPGNRWRQRRDPSKRRLFLYLRQHLKCLSI